MAEYFTNKLTVKGSVESMNEFYAVLKMNSNPEEFAAGNFAMNKFIPIPEVFDEYLENGFMVAGTTRRYLDGKFRNVKVDSNGRTKAEFDKYVSDIEERYGTSFIEEWYDTNWGCDEDVFVTHLIRIEEYEYCVMYDSKWESNFQFVLKLHSLFPNLKLKLEYVYIDEESVTITISDNTYSMQVHTSQSVYFKYLDEIDKYMFVEDTDSDDQFYCGIIHGADWVQSLADVGFYNNNIINWKELVEFMKDYK